LSDWRRWIRLRLARGGLCLPFEDEAVEELANHIEDALSHRRMNESGEQACLLRSKLAREDWSHLAREIRRGREEEDMNDRVRRIWLPGAAAVAVAHGLWTLLLTAGLQPIIVWDDWHPLVFLFLPWLFLLPLVGAGAAYWSRRCGGSRRDLWIACLLPALAMAVYLLLPTIAVFLVDLQIPLAFKLKVAFWRGYFGMVLVPAVLLSLGVLPFLRERARA
jgi:hypothetical protein